MVFFKNVDLCDIQDKYHGVQRCLIARETIYPGELIWHCVCGEEDATFTVDQLNAIIARYPKLENFVRAYTYMIDDDTFAMPVSYSEEKNNDECVYFNHSCEPNCGFDSTGNGIRAIKTIEVGDELTYHYGFLETEVSLTHGLDCKCGSLSCRGQLLYNIYRDETFIEKYFAFYTPYIKQKVVDMKERWYSESCYVKRVPAAKPSEAAWDKVLFTRLPIQKGQLVAKFTSDIMEDSHFIRNSKAPNCYATNDGHVFANTDIPSETELTIYYHGVLL